MVGARRMGRFARGSVEQLPESRMEDLRRVLLEQWEAGKSVEIL